MAPLTMAAPMLGSSIGNEASQRINGVLAQRKWAEPEAKIPSEEHRERHVHELAHSQAAASERGQDLEEAPKRQTNARTAQHKARVSSNEMQSAQDKSASSSRSSTRKIMDYVDAFNEGVEESRHELVQALAHPVDTVAGILTMAWDGVNATTELAFGVTTEGAHARNMQRGRAINDGAVEFAHADGVGRTRTISHIVSSSILGAASGSAIGVAAKGATTSLAKLGTFGSKNKLPALPLKHTGAGTVSDSADHAYNAIRNSKTDVASIAKHTKIKPENIAKVKEHIFYKKHLLDRYVKQGIPARIGRFDSDTSIANAWLRLEAGNHTAQDIMLLKHEMAEAWYMKKYESGYSEAHNRAERRYPAPKEDEIFIQQHVIKF